MMRSFSLFDTGFVAREEYRRADGRENELSSARYRVKLAQNSDGARSKRNAMWATHFRFLARERPNGRVQIKFRPLRCTQLAGANESQRDKFERGPRFS